MAVLVDGAVGGHRFMGGGLLEAEGRGEGGFYGAGELDVFRVGTLGERACETDGRGRSVGDTGPRREEGTRPSEGGREVWEADLHVGDLVVSEGRKDGSHSSHSRLLAHVEEVCRPAAREEDVMVLRSGLSFGC